MEIYLARAVDSRIVNGGGYRYLAGEHPVKNGNKAMEVYLAGEHPVNILESFYNVRSNKYFPKVYTQVKRLDVMLDSGAFTFLAQNKNSIDWEKYIEEYAAFINKYDIRLFFELDIDPIIGLENVERLRAKLEVFTNKKSIPVWHKNRGKDYFVKMCEQYNYVAIGGLTIKEIKRDEYKYLPWFISTAHAHGCKIHGLGFTQLSLLKAYHFDSVDSTAWLYGNRAGYLYRFNPNKEGLMEKFNVPQGKRLKSQESALHNFKEWLKFQCWARKNL